MERLTFCSNEITSLIMLSANCFWQKIIILYSAVYPLCLVCTFDINMQQVTVLFFESAVLLFQGHGFMPVYNGPNLSYSIHNLRRNTEYKFRVRHLKL